MTDSALISAAREGQPGALAELIEAVQPSIYRFALRLCRHPQDAEDVLQETLISLARGIGDFRGDAKLTTWLFTIARRHALKKSRLRVGAPAHIEPLEDARAVPDSGPTPESQAELHEDWTMVDRAMANLAEEDREVIVLRDIQGMSAKEVAEIQGSSVSAVKSRLHRARVALRDQLQPYAPAPGCVDVRAMFSRFLEDDIDGQTCASMQAHVDSCARCRRECDALKFTLQVCRMSPPGQLPEDSRARVRAALKEVVGRDR